MMSKMAKLKRLIGAARGRGSVLVIVVGVLALMTILVAIYATIGQTDRRSSTALKKQGELNDQISDVTEYIAKFVGDSVFTAVRRPGSGDPTIGRDPNTDRFDRVMVDNPSISPFLKTLSADPALRYRPGYVSADNVPQNEVMPPSGLPPGSVVTPWLDQQSIDPREGTSPYLASGDPTWIRTRAPNGKLIDPRDAQRPWLDLRDWAMISNIAPDGRFINLATIRNNWGALPGIGPENALGGPVGTGGRWRTSSNLTLMDRNGNPTLDLALPSFWPFNRTNVRLTAGTGQVPFDFFPYDFTARQISMFRPARENRPGTARLGVLPRLYSETGIDSMVPGDWEYLDNQYADADGDGIIDSRWFEFKDVSDPGRDGRFNTDDDLVRSFIRESPDLRIVAAARIIDLSGKVNVNTATQWRTAPDGLMAAGSLPCDIDLERQLRMADTYNHWPRAGYEGFSQPLLPAAAGFPSNYRQGANYGGTWNTPDGVARRIADDVGGTAFSALIESKVSGLPPPIGRAWVPGAGVRGFYRPLTTPVGLWPFDAYPGQQTTDYSKWTASDRAKLYRLFARDPGSWMVNTQDQYRLYPELAEMLPQPDGGIVPFADREERLAAGSYITPGFFTIQDEIDLRTFEGVNDPRSTSRLEATVAGRFAGGSREFLHLSPLRDNRPLELETLARDLVAPNQPLGTIDGQMDPDAFLQVSVDARRRLTTLSGGRPLVTYADATDSISRLRESEVKVDLAEAMAVLSSDPTQAVRQQWVSTIAQAAADALLPYSGMGTGGVDPQSSAWYVFGANSNGSTPRAEHKLHYGGGRAKNGFTGNSAELALRLSANWAANLIAARRTYSTYLEPANPIHPDDRTEDLIDPRDIGRVEVNTNRYIYPPRNPFFNTQDYQNYALRPRWPREADRSNPPPNTTALRRNTTFTNGFEFVKRSEGGVQPTRAVVEAADQPVILSTLIDEGFRYRMGFRAQQENALGVVERFVSYPGWTVVKQTGDLAPRVAAKMDLGASRLAPPAVQLNANTNPNAVPPRAVPDTLLSQRAMNVYGVTPQPFITQAWGMMLYVDTPPGRPDPGDTEFDRPPNPGNPNSGADARVSIRGLVRPSGTRDSTGEVVALDTGYPDHIVEAFAFQLHNPFDVPLSLSAIRNGRTIPDQNRQTFNAVTGLAGGASDKLPVPNDSQAEEIRRIQLDEVRYYIEFSGRYYALVGTDGDHVERRAITLEPGETRWFYVTDNNFTRIFNRVLNSEPTARSLSQGDQPNLLIERWFRNQLATLEPLGMSFVSTEPSYAQRTALPRIPNSQNPENLVDGRNLRDLKAQPTFKNPPTRLLRINPRSMQPVEPRPQIIPSAGEVEERRKFFDSRRAVRLWRVQREVFTTDHTAANEDNFESEGDRFADGTTSYRRGNVPIPNLMSNDALVDVLRDPNPWRRAIPDSTPDDRFDDPETTWTTPTLHRRLPDVALVRLPNTNAAANNGAQDGVAFINWGTIRRPSDPKLALPLYRDRVCTDNTSQDCDLLPEVPVGVIPAYCMEVKSSLPHRAGIEPVSTALSALSIRTSLNWDVVNGRRRLRADYTTDTTLDDANTPTAKGPTGTDITGSSTAGNENFPRIQVARPAGGILTGLAALMRKGLGDGRPGGIPVVLHQSIQLAPQLQDIRSGDRFQDTEPRFNNSGGVPEREVIRERLQFLRNRSGIPFSQQYIQFPMSLPRVYDGSGKPLPPVEMRPADLLAIPAIAPYETPLDLDGNLITDPDRRWTTLSEAIAQALDYDFQGELDWPLYNGTRAMPADYRLGATHVSESPDPSLGNADVGGCLTHGCLRTDRFVPYLDLVDDTGANTANGEFDAPRDRFRDGRLIGDQRMGAGVPLALGLIDRFRFSKFGSLDSMVHGTINLNTAPRGVLRSVPMLSPDPTGWLGPNRRALMAFDDTRSFNYIGGGDVYSTNLYRPMDVSTAGNSTQEAQLRAVYSDWLETYDLASSLEAYRDKSVVTTRPFGRETQPNFRFGIDVVFQDGRIFWPDGRRPDDIVARDDPAFARQFFTGIPGLRESTGLASAGELLCVRYDGATRADTAQRAAINNIETLFNELGQFPRPNLDFSQDISIDRFARDGTKLAPALEPTDEEFNLGLDTGKAIEGLYGSVYRNRLRQRGPMVPSSLPDDLAEKYVIANAALGPVSVRSDVFCAWFIVRGYTQADVNVPSAYDPAVPSVQKRYVMVLDRSNVKELGDKPRIVFVQEVPMSN